MDGYAIRAADTRAGSAELAVVGRIIAGALPARTRQAGEAMGICTGAPLPDGADAVVPQEDVTGDGERVTVGKRVEPGAFVRPAGEDIRAGDVVVGAGQTISPAEIGVLAALGYARVRVHRRPRVAVLSTGNELADLGTEPGPGQIPNTNTYSLMAQAVEAGAEPVSLGVVPDRLEAIVERIRWAASAGVLVSSAGVSVGGLDLGRGAPVQCGAGLHLREGAVRPRQPLPFRLRGDRARFRL